MGFTVSGQSRECIIKIPVGGSGAIHTMKILIEQYLNMRVTGMHRNLEPDMDHT